MSREHVFADWMGASFPDDREVDQFRRYEDLTGTGDVEGGRWPGISFTQTVRDVCKDCNTGWMSHLERDVAPVIRGALLGKAMTLSLPDQHLIATWATKTALIATRAVPAGGRDPIPVEAYRWFGKNQMPLPRSVIALGRYDGEGPWPVNLHVHGAKLWRADGRPAPADHTTNAMHAVFAVGHLSFSVIVTYLDGDPDVGEPAASPHRVKIWPATADRQWPPAIEISDADMKDESRLLPGAM
jgi:hypothetical protein